MAVDKNECPLCLESLDLDDRSFFPCNCGYQICRFCWHRILSESSIEQKGTCPACRAAYSETPSTFKPLSVEDVQQKLKEKKRQKELLKKQKTVDSRKHLQDLRVVQRNLVFVVGITPRIADAELLKKGEYFGRFGKIHKVVVNGVVPNTTTPTTTPTSYGAYITFYKSEDALRAIQSVNNIPFDGKTIKASLGTTKYCSHFMRNQQCPKSDCMYLHTQGDPLASFTKEDMQMGKHQEYERKLIEEFNLSKIDDTDTVEDDVDPTPTPTPTPQPLIQQPPLLPLLQHMQPYTQQQRLSPSPEIFDPFYETQKTFENIIQEQIQQNQHQRTPPGFNNNNLNKWQWQQEEWIDPAIIYSSVLSQPQQQQHVGHLLGSSLLEDIFDVNSGNGGGNVMGAQGERPYQQQPPHSAHTHSPHKYTQPPPGFNQQQHYNNNFFNFPF